MLRAFCKSVFCGLGAFNSLGMRYVISSVPSCSGASVFSGVHAPPPKAEECEPPDSPVWRPWEVASFVHATALPDGLVPARIASILAKAPSTAGFALYKRCWAFNSCRALCRQSRRAGEAICPCTPSTRTVPSSSSVAPSRTSQMKGSSTSTAYIRPHWALGPPAGSLSSKTWEIRAMAMRCCSMGWSCWSASGMGGRTGNRNLVFFSRQFLQSISAVAVPFLQCFAGASVQQAAHSLDSPNLAQLRVKARYRSSICSGLKASSSGNG